MAWMIGFGNCANLVSSNVFLSAEAPQYPTGFTTGLFFTSLGFCLVSIATLLCVWHNKKSKRALMSMTAEEKASKANTHFRFHI